MRTLSLADLQALVDELVQEVESNGIDPDNVAVYLAHQPSWPFQYSIDTATLVDENWSGTMDEDDEDDRPPTGSEPPAYAVYIAEGQQLDYLSGAATNQIGWGRS